MREYFNFNKAGKLFFRHGSGLRRRLLVWGLALLGIALVVNTLAGSIYTRRLIRQEAARLQTEVASRVALEIEEFLRRKVDRLADLSASAALYELGGKEQRLLVLLMLKNDKAFTEATILDAEGMEVLKVSERRVYLPGDLVDQSDAAKFKTAIRGENYISPVYTSDKAEPYVTVAVPLKVTPHEVAGVVTAEANLKILWEVIGGIEFGRAGYAYLVDGRGNLIAHRDPSLVLRRTNLRGLPQIQEFLRSPGGSDPSPGGEDEGITGQRVLSTFASVHGLGWAVILEEPVDVALADIRRAERYAMILLGAGMLLGALIIVWVGNRITGPILDLRRGAEIIAQGNLGHRVEIKTEDEIGQLAREFNRMAGELQTSYATLEQKVEQRTSELSALYDVTATVNQSLDPDVLLREVIDKILAVTYFSGARIYLLDPEGKELRLRAHQGVSQEFASKTATDQVGVGINGRVVSTGKPLIFEDLQTDPRYAELAHGRLAQKAGYHAYISVPLKAKEKIIGVINFVGNEVHEISAKDIALFTSMANQIGIALENASLFEQVKVRSQQLAVLNAITTTVNRSLEPDVVLKESVEKVCDLLGFDAAWIYVLDPSAQELHLRASKGLSDEVVSSLYRREIGRGSMGKVAASGEPLIYEDIQADPNYLRITAGRRAQLLGFRALCNIPVKSKERILGVLNVASYSVRRFFPEELELIGSIANEIGVGLENARLFEETAQGAQRLSALYTVTSTVSQSLELDRVLQEVIEKIRELFRFDTTRIFLFNARGDELQLKASFPAAREDIPRIHVFQRGQGIIGRVAETGEPLVFEDIRNDSRYWELSHTKNQQTTGFRFFSAFPIRTKKGSAGVIVCSGKMPRRLTGDETQLIVSMTNQIGVAAENANLFYETKQKSLELEEANLELIEANRAKAEFLAAMSHELRTPLNVIIGNADLIKDGAFGDIAPKQKIALDKILHYSETLLKLINDVLTLTKVEASKVGLNVSTFHVDEVITHAQSYVEQLNRNGRLKVIWDIERDLPPVTTDALKLEEILQNLIGNAFKFTVEGRIEVRVRDLKPKERIQFSVEDTGIGIAAEDVDKIFEQFHQLREAHTGTYSGVGLGLNIVKRYVEMMRGDIRVESNPGQGSTFIFELPYSI